MKKIIALPLFFLLGLSVIFGQYQERHWVMGKTNAPSNTTNATLDFFPNGLSLYNTAQAPPSINPPPNNIDGNNGFEGWGVVSNPETGDLLFYTDGDEVFDANHQDITPAGGLGANPSSSQAVVIAVNPVCPFNQYYIFSNPTGVYNGSTSGPVTYRLYTVGGGFSPITPLPGPNGNLSVGEGLLVIPSKTDPFVSWLIVRLLAPSPNGSDYVVYRIDPSGISFNATYNFAPAVTNSPYSPIMNMTYVDDESADNVIVGFSVSGSPSRVFTNTFNTTTGAFNGQGNVVASLSLGTLYDLEFSPNGDFIYYASYSPSALYQVPINGGTAVQMRNFGNSLRGGGLKKAPDGYVYHIYDAGNINNASRVKIGRLVQPETAYDGSNFNDLYQADFNSTVSMIYDDVFAYNFPEFASAPNWSAELTAEVNTPICPGTSTLITASINTLGQNIQSYYWTLDGNFLTALETLELEVDQPGDYQVNLNLEGGCIIVSNLITIEGSDPPQIDNIASTDTPCGGDTGSITITASGGSGQLSYSIDGTDFSTTNTFSNLPAGNYLITVQDELGCNVTQNTEVLQTQPGPSIDMIDVQEASCLDGDGSLIITASGGMGLLRYSVDGNAYQSSNTFPDLAAGDYTVSVVDAIGCLTTASVQVLQTDNGPQIMAVTSEPASCQGNDGSISIQANGVNGALMYSLDGLTFQADNQFIDLAAGSYNVVVEDEMGCTVSQIVVVEADVDLPSIVALNITRPDCNLDNGALEVQADGGTGALSYTITGVTPQAANTFSNLAAGTYNISVLDELGCAVDSTIVLLEGNCPIYVPNVFSPNNDGVNDRFQIFTNGDSGTLIQRFLIFDRWGELVYEVNDFDSSEQNRFWNGTFRGQIMGAGTYVYFIEVSYADGSSEILEGDVLLLR